TPEKSDVWSLPYGAEVALEVQARVNGPLKYLELGLILHTATGFELAGALTGDALPPRPVRPGAWVFHVSFPALTLRPGRYYFGFALRSEHGFEDFIPEAVYFDVLPTVESVKQNIHLRLGAFIPMVCCSMAELPSATPP